MSRVKNVRVAKSLVKKMDSVAKEALAYTGQLFFEYVTKYAAENSGFDSGQGLAHWNIKYYTSSYTQVKPEIMWGYKKDGVVHTPTDPVGYKSQNLGKTSRGKTIRLGPKGSKKKILKYTDEKAQKAFNSRPKGFTSFVVYNPISNRFPAFSPGKPTYYAENLFENMDRSVMAELLREAKVDAAGYVSG